MACTLTVTSVYYNAGTLYISGTWSGCNSPNLTISGTCGSTPFSGTGQLIFGSVLWNASIPVTCNCGGPISFTVTCTNPGCSITYSSSILCCCPVITSFTYSVGTVCNSNGKRVVTFTVTGTLPAGCSASLRINFGNTMVGSIHTVSGPTFLFTDTTTYTPTGPYTASIDVLSPSPTCPTPIATVTVPKCPKCSTNPFLKGFCPFLRVAFLVSAAITAILGLVAVPTCTSLPSYTPLLIASSITAGLAIIFLYFLCRKCICGFFLRLISELFLIAGMCLFAFTVPTGGCTILPVIVPLFIMGVGIILLLGWYGLYKTTCPLTICDFWRVIIDATTQAALATLILWAALIILPAGAGVVGVLIAVIAAIANAQITSNTSAGNC